MRQKTLYVTNIHIQGICMEKKTFFVLFFLFFRIAFMLLDQISRWSLSSFKWLFWQLIASHVFIFFTLFSSFFFLFTSHPRLDPVPVHHAIQRLIPRTHPGPFHKERLVTCLTFESSDIYVTTHNRRLFCCHRNLDQRDRSPRLRHSLNATSSL